MSREVSMRASGRKPSPEAKKMAGKVRRLEIEGLEGGATTKTYRHPAPGQSPNDMQEPQAMLHTDPKAMGDHIASEMADSFPKKAAKAAPAKGKAAANDEDDDDEE